MKRVLIVASSAVIRAGLESLVAESPALQSVGAEPEASVADALEELHPDVLLLHGCIPEALIAAAAERAGVVQILDSPTAGEVLQAIRAGVHSVLPRDATPDQILSAVEAAAAGMIVLPRQKFEELTGSLHLPHDSEATLTARELEVLRMVAEGLGNKAIAWKLGISEHTIKFHISSIFDKLNASSRTEAVAAGIRRGLLML